MKGYGRIICGVVLGLWGWNLLFLPAMAADTGSMSEADYVREWCTQKNAEIEKWLHDQTRVDCSTDNYAIEFDFAKKWKESIGQALHYARLEEKKPGVVLILEKVGDAKYEEALRAVNEKYLVKDQQLRIWTVDGFGKPVASVQGSSEFLIKKSQKNLCHAPDTRYYEQTKHATYFKTIEDCLSSDPKGRLPKG